MDVTLESMTDTIKNNASNRQNPTDPSGISRMACSSLIALAVAIVAPAAALADDRNPESPKNQPSGQVDGNKGGSDRTAPVAAGEGKSTDTSGDEGTGPRAPGKVAGESGELASRMMTPEEEEKFGYTERFRREEEERIKTVALHYPSFGDLQPMLANIKDEQEPTVFEGLPHQVFYPEQHALELGKKETVTRQRFVFYKAPVKLAAGDVRKLNALMKHPDSFGPYLAVNGPGGFQPEFSLVWDDNGKPIEVQVCFSNGGEIKAYHDKVSVYCQMAGIKDALKSMLGKYHKQLPDPEE